jgi:hypothetical protein
MHPEEPEIDDSDASAQTYQNMSYPLSGIAISEADRRRAYLQQCAMILKQAMAIRKDESLMAELRAFARASRDEISEFLDELG